jgi:hypothetical protein
MTLIELLASTDAPVIADLTTRATEISGSTFDNRPTWDNGGSTFDNRPTWDNWKNK